MSRWRNWKIHPVTNALVVELEYTHGLEPCSRKGLEVQILSGAFVTGQARFRACLEPPLFLLQLQNFGYAFLTHIHLRDRFSARSKFCDFATKKGFRTCSKVWRPQGYESSNLP